MTDLVTMKEISERNVKLLELRPDKGHLTVTTTARIADGVRCEIQEGDWKLATDMPKKAGGDETAPTPGMLGRGALASCLAMSIRLWGARLDVPIDTIEVEVEADFDARGELGVGDARAGYKEVRYSVRVVSSAPEDKVVELIATAERHSPYIDVFARAQTLQSKVSLNGREVY